MADNLIPEIHDILKLCMSYSFAGGRAQSPHANPYRVELEADTLGFDFAGNDTWQGILRHHHATSFKIAPNTPDLFLLDMADSLAAAISRGNNRLRLGYRRPFIKYGYDDRVFKLWKHAPSNRQRSRQVRPLDLQKVFEFLRQNPTVDKFYNLENQAIFERAEDATIGANLTSLGVHSQLTGQLYRILKSALYGVHPTDLGSRKKLTTLYRNKLEEWSLTISKIKVHFPQKPVRTRDMHVFDKLLETRENIEAAFPDYVLFNTSDEIIMLRPPNIDINVLRSQISNGFWLEYVEKTHNLKDLQPDPETSSGPVIEGVVVARPPLQINTPICDICQQAGGTKEWVKDYILTMNLCPSCRQVITQSAWPPDSSQICPKDLTGLEQWFEETIHEDLCEACFSLRTWGDRPKLTKLARWSEEKETTQEGKAGIISGSDKNPEVVWVKVSLNYSLLVQSLSILYKRYLSDIGVPDPAKAVEIRFSVIGEFYKDYNTFLNIFQKRLRERFLENMEVAILEDFFVIKLDRLGDIIDILERYSIVFRDSFPQFMHLDESPVRIVLSSADARFPFFEHWEIVQKSKSDIHIFLIGRGEAKMPIRALEEVIEKARVGGKRMYSRALHKLASIAGISHKLADIMLKDKQDKDYRKYREILPMSMDFQSLLTLAKIMEERNEI